MCFDLFNYPETQMRLIAAATVSLTFRVLSCVDLMCN